MNTWLMADRSFELTVKLDQEKGEWNDREVGDAGFAVVMGYGQWHNSQHSAGEVVSYCSCRIRV